VSPTSHCGRMPKHSWVRTSIVCEALGPTPTTSAVQKVVG